jgi:hypothetical protein
MKFFILFLNIFILQPVFSQNLLKLFDDSTKTTDYTQSTFKSSRIVIGQSVESPAKHDLLTTIGHHFGELNTGPKQFFGLDASTIRLGVTYGITDRLAVGFGRSSYQKNIDAFVKYKIHRQSSGKKNMPVTVVYFGAVNINTGSWDDTLSDDLFYRRVTYVNQILAARKINGILSLQLSFSHIHYNLVKRLIDQHNVFAAGAGGRIKISSRSSVNFEYHYLLPGQTADDFCNSLSLGFDIETGGHVFQLFFTNSHPLFERGFIAESTGKWSKGDIYFGFNIHRTFTL